MACRYCDEHHWFWKKIGRCSRCMNMLTYLSAICWVAWWFLYRDAPKSIESIALLFAGFTFNGLLFLHLLFRFVVIPLNRKK